MTDLAKLTAIAADIQSDPQYQKLYNNMLAAEAEKEEKHLFSSAKAGQAMIDWHNYLEQQLADKHGITKDNDLAGKLTVANMLEGLTPEQAQATAEEGVKFLKERPRNGEMDKIAQYLAANPNALGAETTEEQAQAVMNDALGNNKPQDSLMQLLQEFLKLLNLDFLSQNSSISPSADLAKKTGLERS